MEDTVNHKLILATKVLGRVMLVLVGVVGASVFIAYENSGPAITLLKDSHMTGVATPGGVVDLDIHQVNGISCDLVVDRIMWRWKISDNGEKIREIVPFAYDGPADPFVGEQHFQLDLPIFTTRQTGQWNYTAFPHNHCGFFDWLFKKPVKPTMDVPVMLSVDPKGNGSAIISKPKG